jgi:hypothetical protein
VADTKSTREQNDVLDVPARSFDVWEDRRATGKAMSNIIHRTTVRSDGNGITDHYYSVCDCGWIGTKYPQYEDYAYTQAMKCGVVHERDALRQASNAEDQRPGEVTRG